MDLDSIKIRILQSDADLKATLSDIRNSEKYAHIKQALDALPANRLINAVQYIEKNLMPAIKRKSGEASADYEFFKDLCGLLVSSVVLQDRMIMLQKLHANQRIDVELLRERVLLYEAELQKYTTLEDVYMIDGLEHIEKGVRARVEAILKGKLPIK
jgi:hypothetical protein